MMLGMTARASAMSGDRFWRRLACHLVAVSLLSMLVAVTPGWGQSVSVLVTSESSAAAIRTSLADVLLTARQVGGDHYLARRSTEPDPEQPKLDLVGDVEFWSTLEAAGMWIKPEYWRESQQMGSRRDPGLLCAFIRKQSPMRCPESFSAARLTYARPANFKVVAVSTTRLVAIGDQTPITEKLKTELCTINMGEGNDGECVVRQIPRQGGPYEAVRRCGVIGVEKCPPNRLQVELVLRVTSFAVDIDPPPGKRDELVKRLRALNQSTSGARLTVFAGEAPMTNRTDPAKADSCVPGAIANDEPLQPEWLTARGLLSLSEQSPAFTLPKLGEPQINIVEGAYDKFCKISEAFWPGSKCDEEQSLTDHPFLSQSGAVPPSPGTPLCHGPLTNVDHSVSIAGALAGGKLASGRYSVLPSSFVDHARTRLAGSAGVSFPYKGVVPSQTQGRPVIWLVPAGAAPPVGATINSLLNKQFDNGKLHKRDRMIMVVAAPYKKECGAAPVNDPNWDVSGKSECTCYPACLGRVDAAVVVAALGRDGRLLEKATDGQEFHLGPSMVHIAAPGDGVIAPSYSGSSPVLRYRTGVSVATAVAGAASALYYRFVPNADPNAVQARIFATADITDEVLAEKVRFGRLNIARLMLPIQHRIDEAVEENRKRVVIQDVTEGGSPAGEIADARKQATVALVDFGRGYEKAALDEMSRNLKVKLGTNCGLLAEKKPRLWISDPNGKVEDLCPELTDILRLRVVKGPGKNDPPLATVVMWNRTSKKYSPVRVERNWHVLGCSVMGPDTPPSEIPCVVHVEDGEVKPLDLRGKDILFPMWFQ